MAHPMASSRPRPLGRLWPDDEEMAKKDDDLGAPGHGRHSSQWQATRAPRRRLITRLAIYALIGFMVLFVLLRLTSSPSDDSTDNSYYRSSSPYGPPGYEQARPPQQQTKFGGQAKGAQHHVAEPARTYSGQLKYPVLADSLRVIAATGGSTYKNRNVLFAAASLRSAATLLPMACQMALERENYVHFALVSRSDVPLQELLEINGIDDSCKIILHDARPDHPDTSTEQRMMLASARALHHINMYMHPQAILIDSTNTEEEYFLRGIRDQARGIRSALIELPSNPSTRLSWITKLDASSLSAWNKVHFDILIQASPTGSGNLQRLLKSLRGADFGVVSLPHLTIELPAIIEDPLEQFIFGFQWPPYGTNQPREPQMLSLRHRIPRHKMTEEESSVRFLESFWPANPAKSHVLVLSPHAEITPQFFNYVKYSLLQHRYSSMSVRQEWDEKLLGISFQSPSTLLDMKTPLVVPQSSDEEQSSVSTPFLWQSPASDAVLFIGEKWVELHGYVSQVLEKQYTTTASPALLAFKFVGKKHPSWLEYALQLSRIRGYFTLYPSPETASALLGIHTDLYDAPEEYSGDDEADDSEPGEADRATGLFDAGSQVDMMNTLPQGGMLPPLNKLPMLSWDGKPAGLEELDKVAVNFAHEFRREVGQCKESKAEETKKGRQAQDLFCHGNEEA